MKDRFLTLNLPAEGYYMDRGSKFLAYAIPIDSESTANEIIKKLKKEHPKAHHFCTAWRLYPDASLERSNDDGEPSGSAGKPILGQLIKHQLTNVMIVVVRYFGGTKLGVPGLIEAYKKSTSNAIEAGEIRERFVMNAVRLEMNYHLFHKLMNYCRQSGLPVTQELFEEKATLILHFPKSGILEDLTKTLKRYSNLDFNLLEDYLSSLDIRATYLEEDIIT